MKNILYGLIFLIYCHSAYAQTILTAGAIGSTQTICYNTSPSALTQVTAPTGGTGTYTYQWQSSTDNSSWTDISGATLSDYLPSTLTSNTYYRRTVTSGTDTPVYSNPVLITVSPQITLAQLHDNISIENNTSANFNVAISGGSAPYTVNYTLNGLAQQPISNYIAGNNISTGVLTTGEYTYSLTSVTDANGCAALNLGTNITVTVGTAAAVPSIALNKPSYGDISSQYPASLANDNDGTDASFWSADPYPAWWKVDLENAYDLTSIIIRNYVDGSRYYNYNIEVSNDDINYSQIVAKNNSNPATDAGDYYPIVNTTARYIKVNMTFNSANSGVHISDFRVYGSLNNSILTAGAIGSTQTICYNTSPSALTQVTAPTGGTGTYTYQWQSSTDNSSWTDISGATLSDYLPSTLTSNTYYRRTVTSGTDTPVYSNPVLITVSPQITLAQLHDNISIENNTSANFNVAISGGSAPYTVNYTLNGLAQQPISNYIAGNNISTGVLTTGEYTYSLTSVTDANGCAALNLGTNITVTVGTAAAVPSIALNKPSYGDISSQYPASLANDNDGTDASFWSADPYPAWWKVDLENAYDLTSIIIRNYVDGSRYYNYNIEVSNDDINYSQIVAKNNSNPATDAGDYYPIVNTTARYIKVNMTFNSANSGVHISDFRVYGSLNNSILTAGAIGSTQTICYNTSPSALTQVTAPTGGTGTYTYQWQSSTDNSSWTDISGATLSDYLPSTLTSNTYYRRTVTSGTDTPVYSNPVLITVSPQITLAQLHDNISIENNTSANFNVAISGGSAPYTVNYTLNGLAQQPISNYIAGNNISTGVLTTGEYTYSLTSVTDANGCAALNLGTNITVTVGTAAAVPSIALNKPSYGDISSQYPASLANDNDGTDASFWSADPYPAWWKVDLENAYDLTSIIIRNYVDGSRYYNYNIEVSNDDINYSQIVAKNNSNPATDAGDYYPIVNTTARYIKVNMTFNSANSGVHISDFRVYGSLNNSILTAGAIGSTQTICYNTSPSALTQVTAPTGGTGTYTYQWQSSTDNSSWTDISGATLSDYLPSTLTSNTYYRRTVTSGTDTPVYSNPVLITVSPQITLAQLHDNISIENNTSANFNVAISGGSAPYTVNYTLNGLAQQPISNYIAGNNISTGVLTTGEYTYSLTSVTDANGCAALNLGTNITVTVGTAAAVPSIALNKPSYGDISSQYPASLANDNDGTDASFWSADPYPAWWKVDLENAYDLTSIIIRNYVDGSRYYNYNIEVSNDDINYSQIVAKNNSNPATDAGDYYPIVNTTARYIKVNMTFNSANSGVHISDFRVYGSLNNSILTAGAIGSTQTICYNTSPSALTQVTAPTGGTGTYTYQWQSSTDNSSWTDISGATLSDYLPSTLTSNTYYRRTVTSGTDTPVYSNPVLITVSPQITLAQLHDNISIENNTSANFNVAISGGSAPYTVNYTLNGLAQQPISNYIAGNNISTGVLTTGEYTYSLTSVTDANGCAALNLGTNITVTVGTGSIFVNFSTIPKGGTALIYSHLDDDFIWMLPWWNISEKFIGGINPATPSYRQLINEQQAYLDNNGFNIDYESNWITPWADVTNEEYIQYYWVNNSQYAYLADDHLVAFWNDNNTALVRNEINKIKAKIEQYIASPSLSRIITHNNWGEYGHQQHRALNTAVRELAVKYRKDVWMLGSDNNNFEDITIPNGITYTLGNYDANLFTNLKNIYIENGYWTWRDDLVPSGNHKYIKIVDNGNDKSNILIGAEITTPGQFQDKIGGYIFDGIDDYMTLAGNNYAAFSIAMWVRPDEIKAMDISTMSEYPSSTDFNRSFYLQPNGKVTARIYDGTSKTVESNTSLTAGNWSHIAMTSDGSILKIYVNGILENSINAGTAITNYSSPEFILGQAGETSSFFVGQISDVRQFAYALTAREIAMLSGSVSPLEYTINSSASTGGSISPSGAINVIDGGTITYLILPDNDTYQISDVKIDDISVGSVSSFTFNNISSNHTISAVFSLKPSIALYKPSSSNLASPPLQAPASLANDADGTNDSFWSAAAYPTWWKVDLQNVYDLTSIVIRNYVDGSRYYNYNIEVSSDDINYTQIVLKTNTNLATDAGDYYPLINTTARYIRVNMTYNSANLGVHISDFRVYGSLIETNQNHAEPSLLIKSGKLPNVSLSSSNPEEFKVNVYPIPFINNFTIKIDSPNEDLFDMKVYNLNGEIVYQETKIPGNMDKIVILNVNSGVYILSLSSKAKKTNIKIIKY